MYWRTCKTKEFWTSVKKILKMTMRYNKTVKSQNRIEDKRG